MNNPFFLIKSTTVHDDDEKDTLKGGYGSDWFFRLNDYCLDPGPASGTCGSFPGAVVFVASTLTGKPKESSALSASSPAYSQKTVV